MLLAPPITTNSSVRILRAGRQTLRARWKRALPGTEPPRSPRLCLENTDWGQLVTPLHHHSRATGTVFSCAWVRPRRMGDCGEIFWLRPGCAVEFVANKTATNFTKTITAIWVSLV